MLKDVDTGRRKANMPPKFKHKHQQHKREEITDNELISLSVKDLNRLLSGLPPSEVRTLKHRRRTLKNRGYAAHCREKRVVQKEELASEKDTLADENERLHRENLKMRKELKKLKKTFDSLTKFNKMNPKPKVRTVIPTKMMSLLK